MSERTSYASKFVLYRFVQSTKNTRKAYEYWIYLSRFDIFYLSMWKGLGRM